jgi:hypothetical protein
LVAIREVTLEADGATHRYSASHLQDDWGDMTSGDLDSALWALDPASQEDFESAWGTAEVDG